MHTQIESLTQTGIPLTTTVADIVGPVLNATILLELEVSDPEVVAELQKHGEGVPRQGYALGAHPAWCAGAAPGDWRARRDCDPRGWPESDLQLG